MHNKIKLLLFGLIEYSIVVAQLSPVAIEKLDSFTLRTMQDWHVMDVAIGIVGKDSVLFFERLWVQRL
ncbi:hypothetical protein OCK74_11000 [Chitinophagaceae bacterium LB-8]|uniref:Uncharacterized protein n=1 Tax=Paraflavisolibacter caeni TaxID=2982496 RepID=A0A9X2XVC5_9BACT|nr:hypothetical protein [Paraflavisolibacter caeni]MCU7549645.1 hypothetical protein [Paraflavisolibacter caeni]